MGKREVLLFDLMVLAVLLILSVLHVVSARDLPKTPLSPHFHATASQNKSETLGNQLLRADLDCCDDCQCDWRMGYCTCWDWTSNYCAYGCYDCQCSYWRPPYSCRCGDMLESCPMTCMQDRGVPKSRALSDHEGNLRSASRSVSHDRSRESHHDGASRI